MQIKKLTFKKLQYFSRQYKKNFKTITFCHLCLFSYHVYNNVRFGNFTTIFYIFKLWLLWYKHKGHFTLALMGLRTNIFCFYREKKNLSLCSPAVWVGLELLSTEHLLFNCDSHALLTLVKCIKSLSFSAQRTLILEVMMQFTRRLLAKSSISVYCIKLEQWLSQNSPRLPRGMQGLLRGKLYD